MGNADEYRAEFDAQVAFSNGGTLQVRRFRVDVPGRDVSDAEVATIFVSSLGLLMTERVEVSGLRVIPEAHKGTRGGPSATDAGATTRLVELSHVIKPGMTTFPGLPGPVVEAHVSHEASRGKYAPGVEFAIDRVTMVGNTGTYMDTPYHRYADRHDLTGVSLSTVAGVPVVVVRTIGSGARGVDVGSLAPFDVHGRAVLLHTGGDKNFGTPAYAENAPFLTEAGARWLVDHGAAGVGIDAVSIDDLADLARPAHSVLLAAGIPLVEHLTGLDQVPPHGAYFTAAPPRIAHVGAFPVRAFAAIP
jgi:arylformamidase